MSEQQIKKENDRLKLEKAALIGFVDRLLDEVPKQRRDYLREKIETFKLIRPIDLGGDE